MWVCEFCGHRNIVDLMEDEIPSSDVVTYMLQPAPCTTSSGKSGRDESLVIFCVDVSGSMCVTSEVRTRSWIIYSFPESLSSTGSVYDFFYFAYRKVI